MVRTGLALLFSCAMHQSSAGRVVAAAATPLAAGAGESTAQAMVDFKKRVDGYLELRRAVTQKYPEVKETGDPGEDPRA